MDIVWFLYFFIYSVLGWVTETIYCSLGQRKLVERGFLNGPYCPIYGFGAIIILATLTPYFNNPGLIFIFGVLLTSILEYITGYIMEKLFHMRWWDYSARKFNIKGRVCLLNSFLFGILSLALTKMVHPVISGLVTKIPENWAYIISGILLVILAIDCVSSVIAVIKLEKHLEKLKDLQEKLKEELEERKEEFAELMDASEYKLRKCLEIQGDKMEDKFDDAKEAFMQMEDKFDDAKEAFSQWKAESKKQKYLRKANRIHVFLDLKKSLNYQERRIMRSFPNLSHHNKLQNIFLADLKNSITKKTWKKEK
ncbi:MAG: putative ABC transporter permease [Clostridiales bacterium]